MFNEVQSEQTILLTKTQFLKAVMVKPKFRAGNVDRQAKKKRREGAHWTKFYFEKIILVLIIRI